MSESIRDFSVSEHSEGVWSGAARRFISRRPGQIGLSIVLFFVLIALIGPVLLPFDFANVARPDQIVYAGRPPSLAHPFGETGGLQRDVLTLVVNGARTSLFIGFTVTAATIVIGVLIGATAGYLGGVVDGFLMRLVDVMLSLPTLFVILIVTRFFSSGSGDNVWTLIGVFTVFGWMGIARLVRSGVLVIRDADYVEVMRIAGLGKLRIIIRHVLPNALGPVFAIAPLVLAGTIVGEAFISYLGFGVSPTTPTWGNILSNALGFLRNGNWWWPLFPGLCIFAVSLGANLIGEALRDALEPRARR